MNTRNSSTACFPRYGDEVPDDLSIHAIRMVRAGLHGFADLEARGGFQMPHSVDESFLVLVDALDAALRHLGRRAGQGPREPKMDP